MMKLLPNTQKIRKKQCEVEISEFQDVYSRVCHVVSTGKSRRYKWGKNFMSSYADCAMLMNKHLIDLPGKRFLVRQLNEHSRGGHYINEIYLLDLSGNVLNEFNGSYLSQVLLDDKYIWFYISREQNHSYTAGLDLKVIKLNYITGKTTDIPKDAIPKDITAHFWN